MVRRKLPCTHTLSWAHARPYNSCALRACATLSDLYMGVYLKKKKTFHSCITMLALVSLLSSGYVIDKLPAALVLIDSFPRRFHILRSVHEVVFILL